MSHHLVVLRDAYFDLLVRGIKRIECRLGATRKAPYERVAPGDLLWFKSPSGPIRAMGRAGECVFKQSPDSKGLTRFIKPHLGLIRAGPDFFDAMDGRAKYVSLIWIDRVVVVTPMVVQKRDQRAWVVLAGAPRPGDVIA